MQFDYLAWGNLNQSLNIDHTSFVFINAFSEFVGTFVFMFLLICLLINFNVHEKTNKWGLINIGICLALFFAYLTSIAVNLGINLAISDNQAIEIVNTNPLLFNPSFSIAYMIKGFNYQNANFYIPVGNGFIYILFEFIGAFLASLAAYFFYKPLLNKTNLNYDLVKNSFYTSSKVESKTYNYFHEFFNTFLFMVFIMAIVYGFKDYNSIGIDILKQFLVSISLFVILTILGGIVGNALNPFRDLCPRLVCWWMFKQYRKQIKSDFNYAWIPLIAPNIGCILGVIVMPGFLY